MNHESDYSLNVNEASAAQIVTKKDSNIYAASRKKVKVRVKQKTVLERVFGNKNIVKDHYFSAGEKINDDNQRNILEEPSPFIYPRDFEEFSFKVLSNEWKRKLRRKELKFKCFERNNYRSRQQLDMLNRLYVKEPEQQSMRTILDIDPEFFTIVTGRPIKEKFNVKQYIDHMRQVLRTKIVTGFREDEVMLVQENFLQEQKVIDEIKARSQRYVDAFEEFIYNDHTTSMEQLKEAEKQANLSFEKYDKFREMSQDYGALKSQMYNLEEKWRNCKMYQKFLYVVSPISWRLAHDYYHFKEGGKESKDESSVFGRYKLLSADDTMSLEDLISMFKDDVRTQDDPLLHFTKPQQLLTVFRFIELQNLNSLLHSEELAIPLENIKHGMHSTRLKFDEEINQLKDIIGSLEGEIVYTRNLREFYSGYFLWQYLITLITTCSEMYVVTSKFSATNLILRSILYGGCCLAQFAIYCFISTSLSSKILEIYYAVYDSDWYLNETKFRKILLFVILNAQQEMTFTAGGMGDINREAFTQMFKAAMSMMTFVRTMQNE